MSELPTTLRKNDIETEAGDTSIEDIHVGHVSTYGK